MPYEIALVERLISSFKDMLPCYSGRQIDQLSTDKEFYENVNVLIQLHEMRLCTLLRRLFSLLETISRASQAADPRTAPLYQQSQLLVLRLIAMGMFYHWHQIYSSQGVNSDKALISVASGGAASAAAVDDPGAAVASDADGNTGDVGANEGGADGFNVDCNVAAAAAAAASGYQPVGAGYNRGDFNLFYPSPLEEPVAKRAFCIASEYFRTWVSPQSVRLLADTVGNQSRYMFHLRSTHTSQSQPLSSSMMDIAVGTSMLQKFVRACINEPTADMGLEIQEAAGAIFMFVSATNWNVAMQRAKSCLYLVLSRGDEVADLTDIRFLEFASMDITRLAQIIDAFSDVFTRVKAAEQLKLAIVLRRVIWGFISRCGGTFIDMHRKSYRPATNRIEQLMDSLRTIIDSHARSSAHPAFYQLMVMLLMICPDTCALAADHAIEHGEAREDGCSKHVRCLARIHQHLTSRDVPEGIVLASQELQRVASVLTVLPGNNVSRLSDMFEADLNSVLLDSGTRLAPYREEPIDPKLLLISNMACQFQLNPEKALQLFLPRVTGPKTEPWIQLVFAHAVGVALHQRYYSKSINEVPMFNKLVAKLFLDLLRRNVDTIQTISEQQAAGAGAQARSAGYGRRLPGHGPEASTTSVVASGYGSGAARSICDMALNIASTSEKVSILPPNEIAQRVQLVAQILTVVAEEPRLAIWGENEDAKFESLEMIVGAISLCIQEPSIAIQRRAGLALRALFNPLLVSEWVQSADIAFATWTLSLQVIQGICRAIVHSMVTSTMAQHRQLLEIMFDMLVLSNGILELSSGAMAASMEMAEYPQFEVAFEVVVMLHLWADDADITQLTQQCIRLKTRGQQLMVDAGIPVDSTLSNHRLYQELDTGDVKQAGMYSRLAQMREMFRTIRKHMRPTAGAQAAWQETYKLWRQMLQVLLMREETARVPEGTSNGGGGSGTSGGSGGGSGEREMSSSASMAGGSASAGRGDKDDKREQVSRRRNVFEKLTGQSTKHALRNASGSASGSASSVSAGSGSLGNSHASSSTAVQRIGSSGGVGGSGGAGGSGVAGSPVSGSMLSAGAGDGGAMMGGSVRPAGAIAAGAQLPAIIRTPSLTVSELRTQWRYCTGFLLAAGGACISDGAANIDRLGGGDTAEMHSLLEHFIGECLKLIVSDDIQLRELAKEGLGNKTHPGIYMLFLDGCLLNMKRFMQATGEVNVSESRTLFVSQCISIIECLTDRDVTDSLLQSSMNIDFSPVLLTMCKYLGAAALQSNNGALQERIRFTRMVDMFLQSPLRQAIMQEANLRNDLLDMFVNWVMELRAMDPRTLRSEEAHQSKLLIDLTVSTMRALIQVLEKLPVKPMSNPGPAAAAAANQPTDVRSLRGRAYRRYFDFFVRFMSQCRMIEIQEFSSMTSVHATHTAATAALNSVGIGGGGGSGSGGVSSPTTNPRGGNGGGGGGRSGRSESFIASSSDVGVGRDIARNIYSASGAQGAPQRFNRELSQSAELLLNITIKALTNMLAANLEIGLQYSLSVIYHEDTKLRALFTDMFTTILNQGIDIDSLGGDTAEHWRARLIETLVDPGLKLLLGINEVCQVQDIDELGASLINIFESRQQTKILFERIITVELERTDSASELFRRNCLATRLLSYYAKLHGDGYLKQTLVPAVRKLLAQPPGTLTFELNPNKMAESADRDRNLKNVERLCSLVIDAIVGSVGTLPATLRWICNLIYRIVITRFPDAGYTAVGGFVFLRFLCPAIVAPDAHGICAQISNPEVRRGLLLCTKITHNLANDILFGNKETYMVPLNKFISENRARTMRFLSELAAEVADDGESIFEGAAKSIASSAAGSVAVGGRPSTDYVASEAETTADAGVAAGGGLADGRDFVVVQRFIFDHLDRLEPYLARESMVRMHVAAKPSERRKSARAAARAAAAASAAGGSSEKTGEAEAAAAAAAAGEVSASQNLFTQLSYVMRQVGPPAAAAATADANAAGGAAASRMVAEAGGGNGGSSGEELFHEILRRDAHRSTDAIAKKAIIYVGGVSREKRPVVYVIARRMQMQYLDMDAVLLHTLRLLEPLGAKGGFEVFFDLTQFGPANEVPLQWLRQLKRVIPESLVGSVQAVYWYNVNSHFRKYAKAGGLALPPRLAKRSVFPHSLSDLHEFLASPQADLPPGTVSLDSDNGINITPVSRVSRTSPAMPCLIKVTPEAVQITALRRQEVFGLSTYFNDVYHITEIADLQIMPLAEQAIYGETDGESSHRVRSALQRTASRGSEGDRSSVGGSGSRGDEALVVALRFEGGGGAATLFTSAKAELLYKAVRNARARYTSHAAVNQAPERVIRPADVPGTLLNAALLNMGAENAGLRISAYRMLISVVATFSLDVGHELAFASDLCLPPNPLQFTFRICSRLSRSAPDMTLELLGEALLAFTRSAQNMKPWILHYIQPWLLGLAPFAHASAAHPDAAARTQDIVRSLVRLHLKEPTMYMHFKEHVWALVARVEELVDLVLDVMVAVALEYGALTVETELIADMLATVAGKNPRYNKLVPRLRRLVALTCAPAVAHVAAHPVWPEIAVHLRLLLTMSFSNRALADDFLPDVALVTCLLLRAGPGLIQATLHGIVMHVVHSLALGQCNGAIIDATFSSAITGANSFAGAPVRQLAAAEEGGAGGGLVLSPYAQLAAQLAELIQTRTKFNFGLRAKATSAVTFIASSYTRGGAASTLNPEALMEFKDELGGTPAAAAAAAAESPREALAGVDRVAQLFLRIMDNPAYADGRGNAWRARWATLVTASTFVFNPAIQPRAFVLLGRLAAHDEVDDDLLYQTLATLRGALAAFGETDEALPISVLLCLVHMVANLPPDSSYLASLFWVAVAVMQIGHLPLYRVGLSLLSRVLRALDACGAFHADNGDGFQHFLMAARVAVEKAADQVDDAVAISFRSSFSASLSLLLLRGMEDMSTKDETYEVLLQIVAIVASCRKWQQADHATPDRKCDLILPYLILILPTASARNELVHVFTLAGTAISADIKLGMEQGGYVRLLEQIHKSDIARNCQSDYIIYPSILAAMLHKSRANQEIMILYSVLASKVAWVDATMSLLVIESLAPTMTSAMHSSHSSKLTHKLHDVMVRLVITRPHFDPDVFIQQQTLLQLSSGTGVPAATLADIAHSLTVDAIASTTRKSVGIVPPPPRSREDSAERPSMLANVRSQDTISLVSKQSSSPSFANNNIGSHHSPESSFDRAMVPAHREYLSRIGFGGLGRVIVFESSMPHWRELAELASLVVDQML